MIMTASPLRFGRSLDAPDRPFDCRRASSPGAAGNTIAPIVSIWGAAHPSAVLHLLERLLGVPETVDPGGNAGIDRDLQEDFLDLVLGQTVFQRRLDVQLQLMRAIQHADHRQIDDAAEATVDAG